MPVELQFTPLLSLYFLCAVVTIWLTVYGIRVYQSGEVTNEASIAFVGIVFSVSVWTVARFFELLFVSETVSRFWLSTLYVGYGGATISALFFGLTFLGERRVFTRRIVAPLLVVPAVAVGIAATNPLHELFWIGTFEYHSGWYGTILVHEREFQPLFYAYLVFTVGATLTGIAILLRKALDSANVYRRQIVGLIVGALVALVVALLFALGRQPYAPDYVDLSPLGFAVMGIAFAYTIYRHRLLDVVPLARDRVISSMRDGYVVLDTENRILDRNPEATETFGIDDGAVGKQVTAVLPQCADVVADHEPGTRIESEIELDTDAGKRFFLASLTSLSEGEHHIGRLLLLHDITDQRAVRERYRALIEDASDLILVVSPDMTITYASPSVRNVAGVDPDQLVGADALSLVHEDDREAFSQQAQDCLETPGSQFRTEYRTLDADGNILYLEATFRNLLDNPFIEGAVVNAREITGRKEREQKLREANDRLTRANEQLDRFASVISHDLRNPLNVAQGRLELARMTGDDEHFESIERSLDRMETIIEDVLTLAREGRAIGETEPVNLADNARLAWKNVDTGEARLVVADDITFEADRDRFLRMFENLFRNAVEHGTDQMEPAGRQVLKRGSVSVQDRTPSGPGGPDGTENSAGTAGPDIEGGTAPADSPAAGDGAGGADPATAPAGDVPLTVTVGYDGALYIADDGEGIPPEDRDEVFEPGHTTGEDSTGLGLSIVEQIAKAHGWDADVTESADGGARFEFAGVEPIG